MKTDDWQKLGIISEIVGTIVVVASLVFVGFSIRQNTAVVQAETDTFIYEVSDRMYAQMVDNPIVAEIHLKLADGQDLSDWEHHILQLTNGRWLQIWEYAFDRYNEGLMSQKRWDNWNYSFADYLTNPVSGLPEERWNEEYKEVFGKEFAEMVDAAYERRR